MGGGTIQKPALFWLDAHECQIRLNSQNTPIMQELGSIFQHKIKNHIILIDDARLFDLPTIRKIKKMARRSGYSTEIRDGLFRITNNKK